VTEPGPLRLRPHKGARRHASHAVFLDRDGVLNEVAGDGATARSPGSAADVVVVDDAATAVAELRAAGWLAIVVTNQPDVARGRLSRDEAVAITSRVVDEVGVDDAFVCLHDGPDACECRKPKPGLLVAAADAWGIDLHRSWLVGDRWVDLAAAAAAGVRSVLVERPYSWEPAGGHDAPEGVRADATVRTLTDAVAGILASDP
jgi:D-glycero-D-manno-heptose 1,7-bisphosphate phosphatase